MSIRNFILTLFSLVAGGRGGGGGGDGAVNLMHNFIILKQAQPNFMNLVYCSRQGGVLRKFDI